MRTLARFSFLHRRLVLALWLAALALVVVLEGPAPAISDWVSGRSAAELVASESPVTNWSWAYAL